MITSALKKLQTKNLLITGKTVLDRKKFINEISKGANLETFWFPKAMKSSNVYFDMCEPFNLYRDGKDTLSHMDWISEKKSLIITEEFQYMEER